MTVLMITGRVKSAQQEDAAGLVSYVAASTMFFSIVAKDQVMRFHSS